MILNPVSSDIFLTEVKYSRSEYECVLRETYRSEGGVQRPVAEAVLQEQVELLLHEALHHHSEEYI